MGKEMKMAGEWAQTVTGVIFTELINWDHIFLTILFIMKNKNKKTLTVITNICVWAFSTTLIRWLVGRISAS
jgi:hypothetical protein